MTVRTNSKLVYDRATTGYFTAAPYAAPAVSVPGRNVFLGQLVGRGQLAYSVFASIDSNSHGTCEGDVRLFLDTLSAPIIQSDGTETWGCWGMGFRHAPRLNPFSFYLSYEQPDLTPGESGWSLLRETVADCCYFDHFLRFELEHCGDNNVRQPNTTGLYSGQIFVYLNERNL